MLLHKQYPKYGQAIEQLSQFDFFAEDNNDLIFIIEMMVQKNWVDIRISKALGDQFTISNPSMIAEDGWMEYFMGHKVSGDVAKRYNHRDKHGQKKLIAKTKEVLKILVFCPKRNAARAV